MSGHRWRLWRAHAEAEAALAESEADLERIVARAPEVTETANELRRIVRENHLAPTFRAALMEQR